jgi:hypothetical protein
LPFETEWLTPSSPLLRGDERRIRKTSMKEVEGF